MSNLTTIPFELVREIALYLDRPSLKALRLAFVDRLVSIVTAQILFETVVFRLGVEESNYDTWTKRLLDLQALLARNPVIYPDSFSHIPSIFWSETCNIVIDTRYPLVFSEIVIEMEDLSWDGDYMAREGTNDGDGVYFIGTKALGLFQCFIRHVLRTAPRLHTVRWLTSSEMPCRLHNDIARYLCQEAKTRNLSLEVTFNLKNASRLRYYSEQLSNLTRFSLRFMDDSSRDFIRFRSTTFLADIINRSPRLEHIMLDLQGCRGVSGWRAQISKELKAAKNLRSFEYYSRLTPTPKLIPEILLRLKRLVVSKNSITLPLTDDLLLNLRLESFGTSAYSNNVARLLKGCRTTLKELEIWGVEDGPMVEGLGEDFWYNVVARHSPTLKRLAVHVDSADPDPAWYWFDEVWNPANWVLSRCSQLEELKIGWHPGENLVDLVDSLIVTCPKLHLITFDYIGTSIVYAGVEMYGDLCLFKTANPAFGNRQLDLVFENRVGPGSISSMDWNQRYCRNFVLPDFFDDFDPPKWHDTLLKIWRLSENGVDKYTKQKQYAFDRLDTVYALDDGSDSSWRHYECNMGYLDDAIADYNRNKYAWRHRTNVNTVVRTRTLYYRDDDDEDDEDDENE